MVLMFDVSNTLVHKAIHEIRQILHQALRSMITWHSSEELESMKGDWLELEESVGYIDSTSHRINRPTKN